MEIKFVIKEPFNMYESNLNTLYHYVHTIKEFNEKYDQSENDIRNYNSLINKTINLLKDMRIEIIK